MRRKSNLNQILERQILLQKKKEKKKKERCKFYFNIYILKNYFIYKKKTKHTQKVCYLVLLVINDSLLTLELKSEKDCKLLADIVHNTHVNFIKYN